MHSCKFSGYPFINAIKGQMETAPGDEENILSYVANKKSSKSTYSN